MKAASYRNQIGAGEKYAAVRAVLPLIDSTRVHWLVGNVQIPATVVDQLVFEGWPRATWRCRTC